jgi:hypothetical protein
MNEVRRRTEHSNVTGEMSVLTTKVSGEINHSALESVAKQGTKHEVRTRKEALVGHGYNPNVSTNKLIGITNMHRRITRTLNSELDLGTNTGKVFTDSFVRGLECDQVSGNMMAPIAQISKDGGDLIRHP